MTASVAKLAQAIVVRNHCGRRSVFQGEFSFAISVIFLNQKRSFVDISTSGWGMTGDTEGNIRLAESVACNGNLLDASITHSYRFDEPQTEHGYGEHPSPNEQAIAQESDIACALSTASVSSNV